MKFKEFTNWCNERACDGCWGMLEAIACINLINEVMNPIEKKLEEMKAND